MDSSLTQEEMQHFIRRLKILEDERKRGWESHWKDLSRNFLPRRARFLDAGDETNAGEVRNLLQDGIGIMALRILANGMQSGLTSPARPWFSLTLTDRELAETGEAKLWLHDTYEKMVAVFAKSNFYDQIHILYSELACFGTGAVIIEEDQRNVLRCRTLTVGEYALDTGESGRVDTLYRRIRMTPRQMVQAWPDSVPDNIRDMAEKDTARWMTVLHAVEPNKNLAPGRARGKERPWRSVYIVLEGSHREVLEDSGYYEFPALCPRWITTASDVYGASPAMDALGDCLQLQKITEDSRMALEKEVNPPLLVSSVFANRLPNVSPGAINFQNGLMQGQEGISPLYQVRANLQGAERTRAELKDQIQRHFHNDLFLMISDVNKQMTATEVAERNAEKLLMLGPVLDRLRSELFQPLIERVFGIMDRQGLIALPPDVLTGQEVKVEFISILAQAQKQAGISAISQTVGFAGQVAGIYPGIIDKINFDEAMDEWAEMQGVPPSLIRSDEEVAAIREQRAQQMQQQQMMDALQQGAEVASSGARAVKDLGAAQDAAPEGGM
ncbi:head-tail connector protein [Desulfovibrio sp. OttesenSCG-928-A18]|nr:head-tail connector protein [Desulfovibrio sp. OttesenSCG-928-A18]